MITDLVRNDLGRISRPGTVTVTELLQRQEHPGLAHLVSTVQGPNPPDHGLGRHLGRHPAPRIRHRCTENPCSADHLRIGTYPTRPVLRRRRVRRRRHRSRATRGRHPHLLHPARPARAPVPPTSARAPASPTHRTRQPSGRNRAESRTAHRPVGKRELTGGAERSQREANAGSRQPEASGLEGFYTRSGFYPEPTCNLTW